METRNLKIIKTLPIILLLLLSIFSHIGTSAQTTEEKEIISNSNTPCSQVQQAVVTCSTYGISTTDITNKQVMSQAAAEDLLDAINEYVWLIAQTPQSSKISDKQLDILSLASEYGLLSKQSITEFTKFRKPRSKIPGLSFLDPKSTADEWFCNYAAVGEGSSSPVIILPRLIPIVLLPIPRLFYRWNARVGAASCGGLRSGTGFMAFGEQSGSAVGFWGIGFSIFLPPVMAFGIIGYALHCSVEAEYIEYWPPNYPPEVNAVYPLDEAINIPITISEISFNIDDYENELMSYSVTTDPYIGGDNGNFKPDGTYSFPISGLEGSETYSWTVMVTDGPNTIEKTFNFTTEQVAPIVSSPTPKDAAYLVSIDLNQLRFHLQDLQGDLMDYTVETAPNIGSGYGTNVSNGFFNIPVDDLDYFTDYSWYINVTDGMYWKHKQYTFQTEMMMDFNPFEKGWVYRKNITFDHIQVKDNLADFPVLVSIIDQDLQVKTQSDGDDILFMDAPIDGTRLFHEIEYFDKTSGALTAWVKVPLLSESINTTICIYYGNPNCTSQQFPFAVWNQHYLNIQHLNEQNGVFKDSTVDKIVGYLLDENSNTIQGYPGKIDKCINFFGDQDYINFGTISQYNIPQSTVSCWFKVPIDIYAGCIFSVGKYPGNTDRWHVAFTENAESVICNDIDDIGKYYTSPASYNDDNWHYLVSTIDGSNHKLFIDGEQVAQGSSTKTWMDISRHDTFIGARVSVEPGPRGFLKGSVDEMRIPNVSYTQGWIQTEYNNQNNPYNFYIIGPEETIP